MAAERGARKPEDFPGSQDESEDPQTEPRQASTLGPGRGTHQVVATGP